MPIPFLGCSNGSTLLTAAVCFTFIATETTSAETVALYRFDTMADVSDGAGGDTFYDSSGGGLDLVSSTNFGTIKLTADIPALMPADTYSLNSNLGGARLMSSPSTTAFHRGVMGELTVEFWFKSISITPSTAYVLSFSDGSGGISAGDWGVYSTNSGDLRFFDYSNGISEVNVGTAVSRGAWQHVAFSIDSVGAMKSYLDGDLIAQTGFTGSAANLQAGFLKFGRSGDDTLSNHHFLIDDLRISNKALIAGNGTGIGELAWNRSLSLSPDIPPRSEDFGREWVRNHPFTIGAWGFTDYPTLYTDAHFNSALVNGYEAVNNAGIKPMFVGAMTQLNDENRTKIQVALNAGVRAFLLRDELPVDEIPGFKAVADHIRSINSESLIVVGLGASSTSYVDQVMVGVQPDAVIHGFYPFPAGTTNSDLHWYEGGLSDVAMIRERSIFYDVPYFAFIQSFDDQVASGNHPNSRRRLPSESELRAELFSKLSAGVKGFAYFVFQDGINEDIALVDPSGMTSSLYEPAAAANKEVAVLGHTLRFLESKDWRFISGGVASTPPHLSGWETSAGFGKLLGIEINGAVMNKKDALVGLFTDDDGGEYFMVVNAFHGASLSAEDASVNFTLAFDKSVDSIWRLNRLTGEVDEIFLVDHTLSLRLPGGTGDLFKFGNGAFVPEPGLPTLLGTCALIFLRRRQQVRMQDGNHIQ